VRANAGRSCEGVLLLLCQNSAATRPSPGQQGFFCRVNFFDVWARLFQFRRDLFFSPSISDVISVRARRCQHCNTPARCRDIHPVRMQRAQSRRLHRNGKCRGSLRVPGEGVETLSCPGRPQFHRAIIAPARKLRSVRPYNGPHVVAAQQASKIHPLCQER